MKNEILSVAALSRRACDEYHDMFGRMFWDGLGGMCGLASHFLMHNLARAGVASQFIMATANNAAHCWIAVDDFNVDITATQFHPVSPIYHFKGAVDRHSILADYFRGRHNAVYPRDWKYDIADTSKDVDKLMKLWHSGTRYNGITRKRLDNLYRS